MRTTALVCCLLFVLAGCRSAVTLRFPSQDLSRLKPRTLLLADTDHSVVRMTDARLRGDTLVGTVHGLYTAIPVSRLTVVRAVVASPRKTAVLAVLGGAVVVALLVTHPWNDDQGAGIEPPGWCRSPDPSSCL